MTAASFPIIRYQPNNQYTLHQPTFFSFPPTLRVFTYTNQTAARPLQGSETDRKKKENKTKEQIQNEDIFFQSLQNGYHNDVAIRSFLGTSACHMSKLDDWLDPISIMSCCGKLNLV